MCVCVCSWLPVPRVVVITRYQSPQYLFPFFLKFDSSEGFHQLPLKYDDHGLSGKSFSPAKISLIF